MPHKDETSKRTKKKDKAKRNYDLNGKYTTKNVRKREAQALVTAPVAEKTQN
jgi:hypothetical protein